MLREHLRRVVFRAGGRFALPAGPRGKLSILIFHSVVPALDPWRTGCIRARDFDEIMGCLAEYFSVLSLQDAVARLRSGRLPSRSIVITFDDGYRDNVEIALPVLLKHDLTATFFVATGMLDGGAMWNDMVIEAFKQAGSGRLDVERWQLDEADLQSETRRIAACRRVIARLKYLPPDERRDAVAELVEDAGAVLDKRLMMDSEQVIQLAHAGMSVGAHTVSHPILARLSESAAEQEIRRSKEELGELLGREVTLFAYPNGKPGKDYTSVHVEIVRRCGFEAAVTTSAGAAERGTDCHQLPRFTPWDRDPLRFGLRLLMNAGRAGAAI